MELKQKVDRLRDKVKPLTVPAIGLSIIMTGTLLWKVQQDNVDSLQSKIEHLKKEVVKLSSITEKLKLEILPSYWKSIGNDRIPLISTDFFNHRCTEMALCPID
jgi:hypothetical protein